MERKGFTLLELIVVVVIIGILATIATPFFKPDYANQKKCGENLRKIANAIEAYREDPANSGQYPPDGTANAAQNLYSALYPKYISDASVFKCPADNVAGSTDSYSAFYVKRNDKSKMTTVSTGCPRHEGGKYAMDLFFQGQIMKRQLAPTLVPASLAPGQATTSVTLADGSTVSGGTVTFLQSFDIGNGKCYSLFKTDASPKNITVDCKTGNRLEVITPAAIAGVEGTNFVVSVIDADHTDVSVTSGIVSVEEKTGKGKISVPAGRKGKVRKSYKPDIE